MPRFFGLPLSALALLSIVVFCNPAAAGMVATPQPPPGDERELAEASLHARLAEVGIPCEVLREGLAHLGTEEMQALAQTAEVLQRAGHTLFWVELSLGILLLAAGCTGGVWLIADAFAGEHFQHHH